MKHFLIALTSAAGTPALAQAVPSDPRAEIMFAANAYDRCETTYAVRLLDSGLRDEDIYTVASTMCRDIRREMERRVTTTLPAAEATTLLGQLDADPKARYFKKLQAIRNGRAARQR